MDDKTTVLRKLEKLTRIKIPASEEATVLRKLDKILKDFELLQKAPVEGLEPLFYFSESMPLREDHGECALSADKLLQNAPSSTGEHYKIPSFLGDVAP
jgi:aspartyl/glutamyl-tRNA(Asn/Gln) amidotransferase C subunit